MQDTGLKFKVGDRVRITEPGDAYYGQEFTVTKINVSSNPFSGGGYLIGEVDGREVDYRFLEVTPITPAPTTSGPYMAQHHPDGTVTLTPVQEAEKVEEEREPRICEVWRWDDYLLFITDEDRAVHIVGGLIGVQFHNVKRLMQLGEFAYSSLAAAAAAGEIK